MNLSNGQDWNNFWRHIDWVSRVLCIFHWIWKVSSHAGQEMKPAKLGIGLVVANYNWKRYLLRSFISQCFVTVAIRIKFWTGMYNVPSSITFITTLITESLEQLQHAKNLNFQLGQFRAPRILTFANAISSHFPRPIFGTKVVHESATQKFERRSWFRHEAVIGGLLEQFNQRRISLFIGDLSVSQRAPFSAWQIYY